MSEMHTEGPGEALSHALRLVEFERLRESVASYCQSDEGRERLLSELPLFDPESVHGLKAMVMSVTALLAAGRALPSGAFPPVKGPAAKLLKSGAELEVEELYGLGVFARSAMALARFLPHGLSGDEGVPEALLAECAKVGDLAPVEREVFRVFTPEGKLRDLPSLRDLSRRILSIHREIDQATQSFLGAEARQMLQSELPTVRDGRTVLAVKANYRARVRGIVHEVSSTGQTVYIEPEEVFEKNNRLVEAEAALAIETRRLMRELSAALAPHVPVLLEAAEAICLLDGICARAEYSNRSRGVFALDSSLEAEAAAEHDIHGDFAKDSQILGFSLIAARHPLLGSSAIPVDLCVPPGSRVLLITGPNTGGKTVSLKTCALLAAMNQFGLAIPAAEGSSLPLFDSLGADIGDEQSISQSLSTFSAHMRNIALILHGAGRGTLVVLDELGSGTDPEEGAAIAMAVLDRLIERGSTVIVTTHHGILKNYGYTRGGVVNASMDFDRETLAPTYRLLMGIPGESHAIDIAKRNGLEPEIVDKARSYLSEERADVSALIVGLREKHRELEASATRQVASRRELTERARDVDLRELRIKQRERELRELGVGQLNRLLSDGRSTVENLVRELREGELSKERIQGARKALDELAARAKAEMEATNSLEEELGRARSRLDLGPSEKDASQEAVPEAIQPGVDVTIDSRKRGTAVRRGKRGEWVVLVDSVKMSFAESRLKPCAPVKERKAEVSYSSAVGSLPAPAFELRLLGMRLEEALSALRDQLDAAAVSGLKEFSVVHGKGTGVLQEGIQAYLAKSPYVESFGFARPEHGGTGKTIVVLK
jgi:DNA mismatch repair protein MutS2